ncbi:hypothetical protein [Herminiimonas sp. CN]|uniref:hypothetical protein n=1 Tax=Herminiimonas sp. CN TaxID=1349818 RepID=UPI0004743DE2|nr:hypothetical protein [Herminiimonas sp. CN]
MNTQNKPQRPRKSASKAKTAPARTRKDAPAKRAVGRPSTFQPGYVEQAYKLALLGATDTQMADFFGVAERTIHYWKSHRPEFLQSIKRGKDDADANVAEALYKRAVGYSHPEAHISNYQGVITITDTVKHYPPDTGAIAFWLKNRQPDKWRDRVETDVTVNGEGIGELARVYEAAMQRARERQAAVLAERGLSPGADGE